MAKFFGGLVAVILTLVLVIPALAGQDKVTICHAAGLDGTTKFVTLTLAYPAVYGEAGHFYENGTPRAGHEQDYLGPCEGDTPSQSPESSSSPSTSPSASTTPSSSPSEEPSSSPSQTPTPSSTPVPSSSPTSSPTPHLTMPPTDTEG